MLIEVFMVEKLNVALRALCRLKAVWSFILFVSHLLALKALRRFCFFPKFYVL